MLELLEDRLTAVLELLDRLAAVLLLDETLTAVELLLESTTHGNGGLTMVTVCCAQVVLYRPSLVNT